MEEAEEEAAVHSLVTRQSASRIAAVTAAAVDRVLILATLCYKGGWSKALLALFACHPKFLASAKLFAVPKVPKVPNF